MHHFAVWAPKVSFCSVQIDGVSHAMEPQSRGWWHIDLANASHGADYAFLLDDDGHPYPDPRSAWQPYGVHGVSRIFDHNLHIWHDQTWTPPSLANAIIYELHIGTFTQEGTFAAAANRLSHLRALGVTHVEVMPVNSFPGRWGWGYDGVDLFAPQELYGGPEGLKQFVDACHEMGLAVLLDVVYNHFGPDGNYTGRFGPYITQNHHTPWGGAINLEEAGSDEVRRFFCDNALMWLRDYHFDGLRLDAIQAFVDRSAKHFLEQLSEEVEALARQLDRKLVLIAESDLNDPRVVTPRPAQTGADECNTGGYGMDAQWSDDFHHSLFALLTGERRNYYCDFGSIAQLAKALTSVYVYDGIYSEYRRSVHGRPVGNLSAHRFLGYIQNHDQVGNRRNGDRLHAEAGIQRAKLAAALVMTAPFIPMIFQGEEFAASTPFLYFADHENQELALSVFEGRRKEHAHDGALGSIPDPRSMETFQRSKLNWEDLDKTDHIEMLRWYRSLAELRKSHPSLLDGNLSGIDVQFDEAHRWLLLRRRSVILLFNFGEASVLLSVPSYRQVLLTSELLNPQQSDEILLPALSFAALAI